MTQLKTVDYYLAASCEALPPGVGHQLEGIPQIMLFLMGEIGSFLLGLYGSHFTASGPISQDCIAYVALNMSGTFCKKLWDSDRLAHESRT